MVRRGILLALMGLLALSACDTRQVTNRKQVHVLNRIGYGPDTWSRQRIQELGIAGYIEEQLYPHLLDDTALESDLAARFPSLAMDYHQLRNVYHEYGAPSGGPTRLRYDMAEAKLLRALRSKRQLEQVLVDFWFNHFNVLIRRDLGRWTTTPYERDAIRPHVLGRFEDLLLATARHPAMLNYLNNQFNFREGFIWGSTPYGLNENYAREVLELHTVGVDAPYTLTDIQNVARAFTGWTIVPWSKIKPAQDPFEYIDEGHDKSAKSIMGELFLPANGGIDDGEAVIAYLARHPLTAERISRKLCTRFVAEPPPEALVARARDTFLSTDGDLRQVMRTILTSTEFLNASVRTKIKRPFAYAASLGRAAGVADEPYWADQTRREVEAMGEAAYEAAPPTGYPEASSAWIGQGSFITRVNLAYRASIGARGFAPPPPLTGTAPEIVDQLLQSLLWTGVSESTRAAAITVVEGHDASTKVSQAAATLLASPEFVTH